MRHSITDDVYCCYLYILLPYHNNFIISDIGLPSGKSLFQIQAERILCVQRLASQAMSEGIVLNSVFYLSVQLYHFLYLVSHNILPAASPTRPVTIQWYIMTSPFTHEPTQKFFESHKYFGLEPDQVRGFIAVLFPACLLFSFLCV